MTDFFGQLYSDLGVFVANTNGSCCFHASLHYSEPGVSKPIQTANITICVFAGNPERSGKLTIASKVLKHWAAGGHKALLFTQVRECLELSLLTASTAFAACFVD